MRAADARKACPDITLVHVETISEGTEETPREVWKLVCLRKESDVCLYIMSQLTLVV